MKLSISRIQPTVGTEELQALQSRAIESLNALHAKTGKGNDFLGWLNLPSSIRPELIKDINDTAKRLSEITDVVVVIGIGGSYLGAKAVIEALSHSFGYLKPKHNQPQVLFAGQNIGEDYTYELLDAIKDLSVGCIVISKSGTTTEPAIAFRLIKQLIEEKNGKDEAKRRIIAITDSSKGALLQMSKEEEYKTFIIPDDVGGRFSVLTPVGLLPIAIAGFDIEALLKGAADMEHLTSANQTTEGNPAITYAIARNSLYKKGKKVEVLASFNPKLHSLAEWWKQLFGESEGKGGKGIFPASVNFTTDLHSLGQYIQDGERMLFETVISVEKPQHKLEIPQTNDDYDGLNYLAGKRLTEINKMAELGTILAHADGGVPSIHIEIPEINEYHIGQLIYFFEIACGISGYILGVNPFDQPGVEDYKRNMFALLNKKGYEKEGEGLRKRL